MGPYDHCLGRIAILHTRVLVLQDHHKTLQKIFQGLNGDEALQRLEKLKQNPYFLIKDIHEDGQLNYEAIKELSAPVQDPVAFDHVTWYFKLNAMEKYHTLSCKNGDFSIDSQPITEAEMAFIVDSLNQGRGELKYAALDKSIAFMADEFSTLRKDENQKPTPSNPEPNLTPESALQHLKALEDAGHLHPSVGAVLRRQIFEDTRAPGVGNRYAYEEFNKKRKPGVYASLDMNGLKHLNDNFGHEVGNKAIAAFGNALRETANEVGTEHSKVFLTGGDEAMAHFSTPEHAHLFSRKLANRLSSIPPIHGAHQISTSIGLGMDPESADKSMYLAKRNKFKPEGLRVTPTGELDTRNSELAFHPSQTPSFAHSMLPGSEGPVDLGMPDATKPK